jgi:hypothetical protein
MIILRGSLIMWIISHFIMIHVCPKFIQRSPGYCSKLDGFVKRSINRPRAVISPSLGAGVKAFEFTSNGGGGQDLVNFVKYRCFTMRKD